jgi:hypothetical protein
VESHRTLSRKWSRWDETDGIVEAPAPPRMRFETRRSVAFALDESANRRSGGRSQTRGGPQQARKENLSRALRSRIRIVRVVREWDNQSLNQSMGIQFTPTQEVTRWVKLRLTSVSFQHRRHVDPRAVLPELSQRGVQGVRVQVQVRGPARR